MATEFLSFDEVLRELQIGEDELKKLVSEGELRGFRDGDSMKFKQTDVLKVKKGRETEPTIILTDSDQALGADEDADELILDDDVVDDDVVLNIDDIVDEVEAEDELSLDDDEEEDVVPTVEVPALDDEDEDEIGASFELTEEEDDEDVEDVAPKSTSASRVSRSARLRAMQIKEKGSHLPWTLTLLVTSILMVIPMGIYTNMLRGVEPVWVLDVTNFFKNIGEVIGKMFI